MLIEPDTRLDHLMGEAFAKYGVAAVVEQVFLHVAWQTRFAPPGIQCEVPAVGEMLMKAVQILKKWEAMEGQDEKQTD
jgi:hypothetical protein